MSRRGKRVRREGHAERSAAAAQPSTRVAPDRLGASAERAGNQAITATLQEQLTGPGEPIDRQTRTSMESSFGADFGDVRLHSGTEADSLARARGARAFTQGDDIAFRSDSPKARETNGRGLLAHELTHVLQQRSASRGVETSAQAASLEGEARATSRAVESGAPVANVSAPAAAPAVQCDGIWDYLPDVSGTVDDVASAAFDALGPLDAATITQTVEQALSNPIIGPILRAHPALAAQKTALAMVSATPGLLQAVWTFIEDPQTQIDALEDAVRPHVWSAVQLARTSGEDLLRGFGVPESHVSAAGRALEGAASVAGAAAEFVIDDVIVDTLAFYKLRSERESYNDTKQKYDAGLIDTHDFIVEHLAFVLSVLGRLEDIVSIVMWAVGAGGGAAAGGTVGSAAPVAGTAAGAGGGTAVGGAAGLGASEVFGLLVSLGPGALEVERMLKASGDLLLADQTEDQRAEDYSQIGASAMSLVVMAALAFLPGLALRLGKRFVRRVREMMPNVSHALPRVQKLLGGVGDAVPAGGGAPSTNGVSGASPLLLEAHPASSANAGSAAPAPMAPAHGAAAPPENVRAFSSELARKPGEGGSGKAGELIQGPWKPKPDGPHPPESNAAALPQVMERELQATGTDGMPATMPTSQSSPDAPRAMVDPPEDSPPTRKPGSAPVVTPSNPPVGSGRGGGGGNGGSGGSGGHGGKSGHLTVVPPPVAAGRTKKGSAAGGGAPPASARAQIAAVLGNLKAPDADVDAIPSQQARAILQARIPPERDKRARDIWRYLQYREKGRGATRARRGERVLTYAEWTRRKGLKQKQNAARRAKRAEEGSPRPQSTNNDEPAAKQSAAEIQGGPRDASEAIEELGHVSKSDDAGSRNYESLAGQMMERGPIRQRLEQIYGRTFQVLPTSRFPRWLKAAYKAAGVVGPDFVIVRTGRITIVDSVPGPRADHLDKTLRDVNIAHAAAPAGVRVDGREAWWSSTAAADAATPESQLEYMKRQYREEYGRDPLDPEFLRTEDEGFDEALDLPEFSGRILPSRDP